MSLNDIDKKASRYVIYARRSLDEKKRQIESINDQITYCKELAQRDDLHYVDIVKESHSAHESGKRAKFNKLLEEIALGTYDGIIAWHPDRLARNMGDGGRIIELVDTGDIADLRFCTQRFSKDANGKMLLGLAFVLSKQYSDKLSEDVTRTSIEKHKKGRAIGRVKHGYEIVEGFHQKGEFWNEVKKAWQMRIAGTSEAEISRWLNKQGYYRRLRSDGSKQKMTPQKLNKIFKDRFYYGFFTYDKKNPIDLNSRYDFPSMITEDEYYQVQRLGRGQYKKVKEEKPLKGKVVDLHFPEIIYKPNIINNGKGSRYLRYVVDNNHKKSIEDESMRKNLKAISASDIIDALGQVIESMKPNLTKTKYNNYIGSIKEFLRQQLYSVSEEISRLRGTRTKTRNDLSGLEESYLINSSRYDKDEIKAYKKKKKALTDEIKSYTDEIRDLELDEDKIIPSFEKFLNTLEMLIKSYKDMNSEVKFEIAKEIVLNIYAHNGKVQGIELKEPLDSLASEDLFDGRPIRI